MISGLFKQCLGHLKMSEKILRKLRLDKQAKAVKQISLQVANEHDNVETGEETNV